MKKCPYCAEEIQNDAIYCRFCQRDLDDELPQDDLQTKYTKNYLPFFMILFGVVLVIGVFLLLIDSNDDSDRQGTTINNSIISSYRVTYEISGTSSGGLMTWMNAQGGIEQGEFKIPFTKSYTMNYGDFASISVQNKNQSGSVTCRIMINGQEWRESTSTGAFVIAMCDGIVGGD